MFKSIINFFKIVIITIICSFFYGDSILAQINHTYPRISIFHFGSAPAEWYAKFDVIRGATGAYERIKSINPNAVTFISRDWNVWELNEAAPKEWFVRDSNGDKVMTGYGYLMDISDYCGTSSSYNGKKYNEYLGNHAIQQVNNSRFDGYFCQGVWDHPHGTQDVDLDKNGVNDWDEHGRSWLENKWKAGIHKVTTVIMEEFKTNGKLLILNSGRFHDFEWENSHGLMMEHVRASVFNFNYFKRIYDKWMKVAPEPHVLFFQARMKYKNMFREMRYLLTTILLGDGYFSFADVKSGEHNYAKYYDEYDLNLGYPTSSAKQLSNGCWIRFFDNGISITNSSGSAQTVTNNDLQNFSFYSGPYYRFMGGQEPNVNDGSQFSEITLFGEKTSIGENGDGIILLKTPMVVISDLILDDSDAGTSPGSESAKFTGQWTFDFDSGEDFYSLCFKPWRELYKAAYSEQGQGDNSATYIPNFGVAGKYEVFEWHGRLGGSSDQATNVPYTITYRGGKTVSGTYDQSKNYGKWNRLGLFAFDKGSEGKITITNKSNGIVIADAFKFVHESSINLDNESPAPPKNVRIKN